MFYGCCWLYACVETLVPGPLLLSISYKLLYVVLCGITDTPCCSILRHGIHYIYPQILSGPSFC
jgi:hypothetical protein